MVNSTFSNKIQTRQKGLQSNGGPMCAFFLSAGFAEKRCKLVTTREKSSYSGELLTARTTVKINWQLLDNQNEALKDHNYDTMAKKVKVPTKIT